MSEETTTVAPHIPANEETAVAPAAEGERPADWGGASRAELIAAMEAPATETATETPTPEAPKLGDAAAPATPATPADPAAVPGEPRIAGILRAREAANRERAAAASEADQIRSKAREDGQRHYDEMVAKARTDADKAARDRLQKLQSDPLGAIKEIGWDTKNLVDAVAQQGTPEWQLRQQLAETNAKLASFEAWRTEQATASTQAQERAQQAAVADTNHRFLTQHATTEKTPLLRKLPEHVLLTWAHEQGRQWREQGVPFADSDVAEYLEHQLGGSGPSTTQQVGSASGNAPKGKANGSRTPSAAGASERRSSPKPIRDMSPAEERQALIDEYEEANRTTPGR